MAHHSKCVVCNVRTCLNVLLFTVYSAWERAHHFYICEYICLTNIYFMFWVFVVITRTSKVLIASVSSLWYAKCCFVRKYLLRRKGFFYYERVYERTLFLCTLSLYWINIYIWNTGKRGLGASICIRVTFICFCNITPFLGVWCIIEQGLTKGADVHRQARSVCIY